MAAAVLAALVIGAAHRGEHGRDAVRIETRGEDQDLATLMRTADPSRGAKLFGQCAACHPIRPGSGDRDGPNLYGVVDSPVSGRRPRFAYTAALRRLGGLWTVDRLNTWLTSPAAMAPGTSMAFRGLPDAQARADLIAYLRAEGRD